MQYIISLKDYPLKGKGKEKTQKILQCIDTQVDEDLYS